MTAVFIRSPGYPRCCRLLTIGTSRHVTACRASIDADDPVILTARLPADLCSACREDLRIRSARAEDLTPWRGEIGVRAELTVERAAEEMFGLAPTTTVTEAHQTIARYHQAVDRMLGLPAVSRTITPLERPLATVDPVAAWDDEHGGTVIARIDDLEDACR